MNDPLLFVGRCVDELGHLPFPTGVLGDVQADHDKLAFAEAAVVGAVAVIVVVVGLAVCGARERIPPFIAAAAPKVGMAC